MEPSISVPNGDDYVINRGQHNIAVQVVGEAGDDPPPDCLFQISTGVFVKEMDNPVFVVITSSTVFQEPVHD
jgi:hypothetical protein